MPANPESPAPMCTHCDEPMEFVEMLSLPDREPPTTFMCINEACRKSGGTPETPARSATEPDLPFFDARGRDLEAEGDESLSDERWPETLGEMEAGRHDGVAEPPATCVVCGESVNLVWHREGPLFSHKPSARMAGDDVVVRLRPPLTKEQIIAALARASDKALKDQRRIAEASVVTQASMEREIITPMVAGTNEFIDKQNAYVESVLVRVSPLASPATPAPEPTDLAHLNWKRYAAAEGAVAESQQEVARLTAATRLALAYSAHIDHEQGCLTEEGEDCDCQRSVVLRALASPAPHTETDQ